MGTGGGLITSLMITSWNRMRTGTAMTDRPTTVTLSLITPPLRQTYDKHRLHFNFLYKFSFISCSDIIKFEEICSYPAYVILACLYCSHSRISYSRILIKSMQSCHPDWHDIIFAINIIKKKKVYRHCKKRWFQEFGSKEPHATVKANVGLNRKIDRVCQKRKKSAYVFAIGVGQK